jgi:hypothetical protein
MNALIKTLLAAGAAWMALSPAGSVSRELPRAPEESLEESTLRRQFFGAIARIDRPAKVLEIDDQSLGRQRLHLDGKTKILQGDKAASWSDFQVGATVDGVCIGAPHNAYAEIIYLGR